MRIRHRLALLLTFEVRLESRACWVSAGWLQKQKTQKIYNFSQITPQISATPLCYMNGFSSTAASCMCLQLPVLRQPPYIQLLVAQTGQTKKLRQYVLAHLVHSSWLNLSAAFKYTQSMSWALVQGSMSTSHTHLGLILIYRVERYDSLITSSSCLHERSWSSSGAGHRHTNDTCRTFVAFSVQIISLFRQLILLRAAHVSTGNPFILRMLLIHGT